MLSSALPDDFMAFLVANLCKLAHSDLFGLQYGTISYSLNFYAGFPKMLAWPFIALINKWRIRLLRKQKGVDFFVS